MQGVDKVHGAISDHEHQSKVPTTETEEELKRDRGKL